MLNAFRHALNGTFYFIRHDRNGRIHFAAAFLVAAAGVYCGISATEWCILLICIGLVIGFEMLNHALENLCNLVHAEYHPLIKATKDVAAGAVLWASITSAVTGLVIFIPKLSAVL